ncbi:hypothetical protein VRC29_11385 [Erwinia aphidicola]|uniref:hypothetical protein n=1 Tax=Erwinia aphidicola TaxID=68334 RepID=UPI0030CC08E7
MAESPQEMLKSTALEIFQPLKENMTARLKAPFFAGFVVSRAFINWERIAIFFASRENIYTRLEKIHRLPQHDWPLVGSTHTNIFWYPLCVSLAVTIAGPVVAYAISLLHDIFINKATKRALMEEINNKELEAAHSVNIAEFNHRAIMKRYSSDEVINQFKKKSHELAELENNLEQTSLKLSKTNSELSELEAIYISFDNASRQIIELHEQLTGLRSMLTEKQSDINQLQKERDENNITLTDQQNKIAAHNSEKQAFKSLEEMYRGQLMESAEVLFILNEMIEQYAKGIKMGDLAQDVQTYNRIQEALRVSENQISLLETYRAAGSFPQRTLQQRIDQNQL